ncbi:MAG: SpoIIE family protein phosphatase [Jaaginema sp. PMC 1079.18]|nr:SpoIIE family protein phosphatase [Jaaginema sp. PMC 1080.18]MEC4849641.1 SpoIIE family protein phosphatase [Jaaginema sp. PMC 1079.18]MEC4864685.1 SpoIIE family protein phosphatase [Jaaginema sp. PMC 1078.18]
MNKQLREKSIASHPRKIRLQTTLVLPFVLQCATLVGLVGWLSYRSGQQAINDLASQLQQEISLRVKADAHRYLQTPQDLHETNLRVLRQNLIDPQDFATLERYFWSQSQSFPELGTIAFANAQGEFVGANGLENYLVSSTNATGNALRRYAVDLQGDRGEILREKADYDARTRGWYQTALEKARPSWTEIEPSAIGKRLDFSLVYPVYDRDRGFLGVLLCDVPLFGISEILQDLKIGKTGQAFIIDREGRLVASSTQTPLMQLNADQEPLRLSAFDSDEPLIRDTTKFLATHFSSLQSIRQIQQLRFQRSGEVLFIQVTPLQDNKGLDWLIVTLVPESDFMAQIHQNTRYTILLTIVALGGAIALGIIAARRITQPIEDAIAASDDLARGKLDRWLKPNPIVELNTLANGFNYMAQRLQNAVDTLEDKVQERTAELENANQKINTLNQKLKSENLRMGAELDIARQLQRTILPTEQELQQIPELDIFGYMEAADEVGGDYYDILRNGDRILIAMGDVTGHGLESGILTIMTQTAIRTLQMLNKRDLCRSLNILNRTIYHNAQRLGSQRYLSLVLLDYSQGRLSIAGQHEEIIIIRADGTLERLDTEELGFPVGMIDDIAEFSQQCSINLEIDDLVILYTDGITEAENNQRELYGIERLLQVSRAHHQRLAQEIVMAIVADVRKHIGDRPVFDDITLVALKRNF